MSLRLFSPLLRGVFLLGLLWIASPLQADTLIDFENLGALPEQTLITTQHGVAGVTFNNAQLIKPGSPATGFQGFGTGGTGGFDVPGMGEPAGGLMISDPSAPGGNTGAFQTISVDFAEAVTNLTFQAVDIDGNHQFRGRIFDGDNNLISSLTINAGDADTGDGVATLIDFSAFSGIRRLEFEAENTSFGNSGFGADNFQFTVIPEPASMAIWSLLGLVVGVGIWRRRRK